MKLIEKSASKKMNINDIPDPRPSDGTWGTPIPNSYGNSHCNKTLSGNHYFDEVIDYRLSGETPDTRMVDKVYTGVYKCKYCGIIDDSRQPIDTDYDAEHFDKVVNFDDGGSENDIIMS